MSTNKFYDVIIIGAGPGGIYSAYELKKVAPSLKVAVFESGNSLEKRKSGSFFPMSVFCVFAPDKHDIRIGNLYFTTFLCLCQ